MNISLSSRVNLFAKIYLVANSFLFLLININCIKFYLYLSSRVNSPTVTVEFHNISPGFSSATLPIPTVLAALIIPVVLRYLGYGSWYFFYVKQEADVSSGGKKRPSPRDTKVGTEWEIPNAYVYWVPHSPIRNTTLTSTRTVAVGIGKTMVPKPIQDGILPTR